MELGLELEPRVKLLPFKIKAMSRESPPQKAAHLLDPDLRTHWSTGTNTKEWILLELEEACLLSQIRIYNKSVLEWEITAGLRYKPEAFVKVRPRCESPRREVIYPMNYTPCRYVRISCLRGNPISVFFVQLFGVSVSGLEPEFQPVVNYLLPHILSHKQEAHDIHLQLLQDITNRLLGFLPQLELELANFIEDAESNIRFLAMLAGPFCPILRLVNERETKKPVVNTSDLDAFRYSQSSSITVSSNFEAQPRRSRSPSSFNQPSSSFIVFRPDAVIILLRKAYKDSKFGNVCRLASRIIQKLVEPLTAFEESLPVSNLAASAVTDEFSKAEPTGHLHLTDYSCLFGEEFKVPDDQWDTFNLNVLDIAAVEEGILHVLYACASQILVLERISSAYAININNLVLANLEIIQPHLCCKLADAHSAFSSILPLIQALLPALRPPISNLSERMDDTLWQWKHPSVQQALSQIVVMASSPTYLPLLRACAGYLSSFITSHVKAACVLIDLCSGPLSPWMLTVIAKVDLAVELVEDLLGVIQGARQSIPRARAALKYVLLALSGHMDDVLVKYKEFKHNLLFLLQMLEPFLDPALDVSKNTIAFGDISAVFIEKQERTCAIALAIIRSALLRPAVLPSLESQWKHGSVAPSVLLSVLGSHMPLPPEIDLCRFSVSENGDQESSLLSSLPTLTFGGSIKSTKLDEFDGKNEVSEATTNIDVHEDAAQFFAPQELRRTLLTNLTNNFLGSDPDKFNEESRHGNREKFANDQFQNALSLDNGFSIEYINLQADYLQLANFHDCEYRASEFQRLAMEISSQYDVNPEGHDAVIDALLLAAECYANPFFMLSFRPTSTFINHMKTITAKVGQNNDAIELKNDLWKKNIDMEKIAQLEGKRDKTILYLLLHAAKLDQEYLRNTSPEEVYLCDQKSNKQNVSIDISPLDIESVDAVTLVRQNQIMLCHFLMKKLKKEQHSSHEVLLQSLLFFLCSATELSCHPEDVIDVLIHSTVNLNALITSFYNQLREGKVPLDQEKLHGVQRCWVLLRHLIIASSGSCEGTDFISRTRKGFHYRSLIPHSSWMQEISNFSNCSFPLARFLGWMAVSRYAQHYLKERLFLASDLSQLTSLLSIFVDELSCVGNKTDWKSEASKTPEFEMKQGSQVGNQSDPSDTQDSFCVLYPDMHKFFPSMRKQFRMFGETILEAVGLQLKCLPHSAVPEALCWFSDLCLSPYPEADKDNFFLNSADHLRGHVATNVKSVLLYILESIVSEHMEYMLPEMPRVAQILISLCKTSYCDVAFLNSILCVLRPLISYFLRKATHDEKLLEDVGSEFDFELVSFEELFECLRCRKEIQGYPGEREIQGSQIIFILGSLFPDLSFRRKSEILRSLLLWVDFATSEPTSSFYSYLYAFQKVIDNCNILLAENIKSFGIHIPSEKNQLSEGNSSPDLDGSLPGPSGFHDTSFQSTFTKSNEEGRNHPAAPLDQGVQRLSSDEIIEFSKDLELLISKLLQSIEFCWNLHCRLAMKLTYTLAKCFMFSRCSGSINQAVEVDSNDDGGGTCPSELSDLSFKHWRIGLEGLIKLLVTIQQDRCWQVASAMLDYLLGLPPTLPLDCVVCTLCTAIKNFCCHAPRISWRLQSDKWLSSLIKTGLGSVHEDDSSVADLFCTMLRHSEPEQRAVALQHLGRIVGLGMDDGVAKLSYTLHASLIESDSDISIAESVISVLVSSTWDIVANLALSDPSLLLQRHAMALLSGYIPFAKRSQLQSFLVSTNTILQGLGRFSHSMEGIQSIQLSLSLLASACLYSPTEDIALIPESVWKNLESMGKSGKGALDSKEKSLCLALCKLRNEPVDVKKVLNEVLSSSPAAKPSDPNFQSTRESILEVISSLTSIQSYFDFFSGKVDQELQELEEAEIEMELLLKEKAMKEVAECSQQEVPPSYEIMDDLKYNNRIQKIKEDIRTLEKLRIREELIAHREKKLLKWHARQSYLEEVASREMELLQGLDRERTSQFQCEIERQRLLELERAKTKELQHNLEMERERQTQRELQQELEQVEAGIRPTRREFSLNTTRPKERYRERESGRSAQEGSLRPGSRGREGGGVQAATSGSSMTSPGPTVMLAGSRSFSGQFPNILQARDLPDERSSVYEDNLDGSRDSGDANSIGDPELATAFDSLGGGFVSATRQGSRGSKSRQVTERRERDGRREGKWERKHL